MGQPTIWHYLVMLILVALLLALVVLAIIKPHAFRKMFLIVAIGSSAPLAFEAVNLVARLAPNAGDLSGEAAEAPPSIQPPKPAYPQSTTSTAPAQPQTGSRKAYYNRRRLKAVVDVAGCQWPDDYDKFNSLTSAHRSDLASKLDCIIIHRGEMVVQVDVIGDLKQVVWEKNGQTLQLWSGSYYFKNERDWAQDAECEPGDSRCRAKVASRFELEY